MTNLNISVELKYQDLYDIDQIVEEIVDSTKGELTGSGYLISKDLRDWSITFKNEEDCKAFQLLISAVMPEIKINP